MIFHLSKAPSPNQAVIRTNDTDVLIIALGCFKHLPEGLLVWLNQLHMGLGVLFCDALPGFLAMTGYDYLSSFCHEGKQRPAKKLETDVNSQIAFAALGSGQIVSQMTDTQFEIFACKMCGHEKLRSTNDLRFEMFASRYRRKKIKVC